MDKREDTGNYYPGGTVVTGLPVPAPGGGSSVEVVAPSLDGAGKAADAKAVYEELEKNRDASLHSESFNRKKDDLNVYELENYFLHPDCLPITGADGYTDFEFQPDTPHAGHVIATEISTGERVDYAGLLFDQSTLLFKEFNSWLVPLGPVFFNGKPPKAGVWPKYQHTYYRNGTLVKDIELAEVSNRAGRAESTAKVAQDIAMLANNRATEAEKKADGNLEEAILRDSNLIPRYKVHEIIVDDSVSDVSLKPYNENVLIFGAGRPIFNSVIINVGYFGDGSVDGRYDLVLRIEPTAELPPIIWPANFHPRTDVETDFACVVGVRNVYWLTEYAPNEFCVAGWQETEGR